MKTELLEGKIGFLGVKKRCGGGGKRNLHVKVGPWSIVNIVECLVHPIDRMH
jgi:hypothetical protein